MIPNEKPEQPGQPPPENSPPQPAQPPQPDLAAIQRQLEQQSREINTLRQRGAAPPPPQPQQPPAMNKQTLEAEFWKNPLDMVTTIARMAASEATGQFANNISGTILDTARRAARDTDPETFDRYRDEIEAAVMQAPENIRGNAQVWVNAFRIVKGSHVDDIVAERMKKAPVEAPAIITRRGDGPAPPNPRAGAAPSKTELSDIQKRVARNLGLTEDQYRHGMEIQEKQESDVREDSPWDRVITVDSAKRRREQKHASNNK